MDSPGSLHGLPWRFEGRQEAVTCGFHLRALEELEVLAHGRVMPIKQFGPASISELRRTLGGFDDVAEQNGDDPAGGRSTLRRALPRWTKCRRLVTHGHDVPIRIGDLGGADDAVPPPMRHVASSQQFATVGYDRSQERHRLIQDPDPPSCLRTEGARGAAEHMVGEGREDPLGHLLVAEAEPAARPQ